MVSGGRRVRRYSSCPLHSLSGGGSWPRQIGNNGVVRVIVPLTEVRKSSKPTAGAAGRGGDPARMSGHGLPADVPETAPLIADPGQLRTVSRIIEALKGAVETLRSQLEREHSRVDQAEHRIGELQAALADAVGAERIAAG